MCLSLCSAFQDLSCRAVFLPTWSLIRSQCRISPSRFPCSQSLALPARSPSSLGRLWAARRSWWSLDYSRTGLPTGSFVTLSQVLPRHPMQIDLLLPSCRLRGTQSFCLKMSHRASYCQISNFFRVLAPKTALPLQTWPWGEDMVNDLLSKDDTWISVLFTFPFPIFLFYSRESVSSWGFGKLSSYWIVFF